TWARILGRTLFTGGAVLGTVAVGSHNGHYFYADTTLQKLTEQTKKQETISLRDLTSVRGILKPQVFHKDSRDFDPGYVGDRMTRLVYSNTKAKNELLHTALMGTFGVVALYSSYKLARALYDK